MGIYVRCVICHIISVHLFLFSLFWRDNEVDEKHIPMTMEYEYDMRDMWNDTHIHHFGPLFFPRTKMKTMKSTFQWPWDYGCDTRDVWIHHLCMSALFFLCFLAFFLFFFRSLVLLFFLYWFSQMLVCSNTPRARRNLQQFIRPKLHAKK